MKKTQPIYHTCMCGHRHVTSPRQIDMFKELINTLYSIHKWCIEKRRHEFQTKDVRHLFDNTQYCRFGDMVHFGGLLYKAKKGHWGMNMARCEAFFKGEYKIPAYVIKDPITKAVTQGPDVTIKEIKNIGAFLNANKEFMPTYLKNDIETLVVRDENGKVERVIYQPKFKT